MNHRAKLFFILAAAAALAADDSSHRVKVYNVESGMTAPELLPAPYMESAVAPCNKKKRSVRTTDLNLIVDAQGQPRNLYFKSATGSELDEIALRLASADRFKPAVLRGEQVAAWALLETEFQVCVEQKKVGGTKVESFHLIVPPIQTLKQGTQPAGEAIFGIGSMDNGSVGIFRIGGGVTAPVPIISPEAQYSDDARKKKIAGVCLVTLIVDPRGMPLNVRVIRPLYPSLDQKALEAVRRYRFKPAMKDGVWPVPVMVTIEVNFRLY